MARFQGVVPQSQLGRINIVGSQQPVANTNDMIRAQVAQEQQMQLRANQDQRAAAQLGLNQQAGQRQESIIATKRRDQYLDEASLIVGEALQNNANPMQIKGMLQNFVNSADLTPEEKAEVGRVLDDPQGFNALTTHLVGRYKQGLSQRAGKGVSTKLSSASTQTFRLPNGREVRASLIVQGPQEGRYKDRDGNIIPPDAENITRQRDMEKATAGALMKSKVDWYDKIMDESQESATLASQNLARVEEFDTLRQMTSTGSWAGVANTISSITQGLGVENDEQGVRQALDSIGFDFARANFDTMKGAISNREFKRLQEVAPNIRMTPQGLTLLLDLERQHSEWAISRAQFIEDTLDPNTMSRKKMQRALREWERSNPPFNREQLLKAIELGSKNPNLRQVTFKSLMDELSGGVREITQSDAPADDFSYSNQIKALEQRLDN